MGWVWGWGLILGLGFVINSLIFTFVIHICYSHLIFTFVIHICYSHLLFTFVIHICNLAFNYQYYLKYQYILTPEHTASCPLGTLRPKYNLTPKHTASCPFGTLHSF